MAAQPRRPIIVVPYDPEWPGMVEALRDRHQGDLGVPGREAFTSDGAVDAPLDGSGRRWPV